MALTRREFVQTCATPVVACVALAVIPKAPEPLCRCGRPISEHTPFDMDAFIKESAQKLADEIDRRAVAMFFGES